MTTNDVPVLSLALLLRRLQRRRWLVLMSGLAGVVLVAVLVRALPRYEVRLETMPPAWESVSELNKTGLVDFDRQDLYRLFLDSAQSRGTVQRAWASIHRDAEGDAGAPTVSVAIEGGLPAEDDAAALRTTVVATGSAPQRVDAFMSAVLQHARRDVLDDARERLRGALAVHRGEIERQIGRLLAKTRGRNGSDTLPHKESRRHEDRLAALQGGHHERVPYAFMDLSELQAELAVYDDLELPDDPDAVARLDWESQEGPRSWYTIWHPLAGLLAGLLLGAWLAVVWDPTDGGAQSGDD